MRPFFLFLALFSGCLLVVDGVGGRVLNHWWSSARGGQNGGQISGYLARPAPPAVLLMGNSRVGCNVDPASFGPGALTIAHNGSGQALSTGLVSVMQQAQKLPAVVVLHIDLEEYAQESDTGQLQLLSYFYGQNDYVTRHLNAQGWAERVKLHSALYRHNGRLLTLAKNWLLPGTATDYGFQPLAPSHRDSLNTLYSSQQLQQRPAKLNRAPLQELQAFVSLCEPARVNLICFTSPYYRTPPRLARAAALVDSLLRKHEVPYLNYGQRAMPALQGSAYLWRDVGHLNSNGIPLFSSVLVRQVHEQLKPAGGRAAHRIQGPPFKPAPLAAGAN
ncbi:hypothetical protein [Hymenobacter sp. IS2118]|uniref:hypothetical protein n=1 Tax=Hymenobacter sp. IS2118 TaxID=1505605 RepID=UPI0005588353|nr:hypothetical protein [Hymenobacter sp. IS2118]